MISSVSFSGTQNSNFQDLIRKPQAFPTSDANAASGVSDSFEKKHSSKLKKAGILLAVAAAITAGLAAGHKTEITKKIPKVGKFIDGAGEKICNAAKTVVNMAKNGIENLKNHSSGLEDEIETSIDNISEKVTDTVADKL